MWRKKDYSQHFMLLRYAKLIPPTETDFAKWETLKLDAESARILFRRTKEFVVCGFQLTAEQALGLTEAERRCLLDCTEQCTRETIGMIGRAVDPDIEKKATIFNQEREYVPSTDELKYDYIEHAAAQVRRRYSEIDA